MWLRGVLLGLEGFVEALLKEGMVEWMVWYRDNGIILGMRSN